jgi:lysophospholipase L1-like esterase
VPNSYNDNKYTQRNTSGRNALDDYQKDREYWIAQGGDPKLSLGDMIRKQIGGTYPNMSVQDAVYQALLSGSPAIADPRFVFVGDSLTQYGNQGISLNTRTLTRNAAGLVTVAFTSHGVFGEPNISIVNCSDASYEYFGPKITIDANSFSYQTSVTGAAGSIVGGSLTQVVVQNKHQGVGYWPWLQSAMGGGGRVLGNFGQGGDQADAMAAAVTQACATDAEFVILCAGINDINSGGASGATAISRVTTHVNTITGAGKKCILISIPPLGSAYATVGKNTATLDANAGLAALHNGNSVIYVDIHQHLVDTGATRFTDGRAWSWATSDGVHWGERASKIVGADGIYPAISSKITTVNCLPTSSGNMPTIPGFTAIREYTEWDSTGGGTQGTGSTGTLATKQTALSSNAATTIVNSLVDRGSASLGYYNHQVITPGGAHIVSNYWMTNSGVTIGSLGLTTSDTVMMAIELSVTGAIAANLSKLNFQIQTNSSGAFGIASCGDFVALANSTYRNDSLTDVILMTGELKLNASVTHLLSILETRYTGAGSAHTLRVGRVVLFKKNP